MNFAKHQEDVDDIDNDLWARQAKTFVRFERIHQNQTGPLYGPFDTLDVTGNVLIGHRRGSIDRRLAEFRDGGWYLVEQPLESLYIGFSILCS